MGNLILFPAPKTTYSIFSENVVNNLVWIDASLGDRQSEERFPALWFPHEHSVHTLLYLHGNSADLGDIAGEMLVLHQFLGVNVLAVEFPGYGVTQQRSLKPNAAQIDVWVLAAFHWLRNRGIATKSIIPFGRSIGTGPAAKLAAARQRLLETCGGLILHSPYTSIHDVVRDYSSVGWMLIGNHWNTLAEIKDLANKVPVLLIHGQNDGVIPWEHARRLGDALRGRCTQSLYLEEFYPQDSPHNAYDPIEDLVKPIRAFLDRKALSRLLPAPQSLCLRPCDLRPPSDLARWPRAQQQQQQQQRYYHHQQRQRTKDGIIAAAASPSTAASSSYSSSSKTSPAKTPWSAPILSPPQQSSSAADQPQQQFLQPQRYHYF